MISSGKIFCDFSCLPLHPHARASSEKWRDSEDMPFKRKLELMDSCASVFPKTFWYTELLGRLGDLDSRGIPSPKSGGEPGIFLLGHPVMQEEKVVIIQLAPWEREDRII